MWRAVLFLWAALATVAAAYLHLQEQPPTRAARPAARWHSAEVRRLKRWVRELEQALAATLEPPPAVEEGAEEPPRPPLRDRLGRLLSQARRLVESETWNVKEAQAIDRQIYALVAYDTKAHLALVELLREARTEDESQEIVGLLIENAFSRMTRSDAVSRQIRQASKEILRSDPQPHRRAAAARVLFGYEPPGKREYLLGLERLEADDDATVREEILTQLATTAQGLDLTEDDARPLLERLRAAVREGTGWSANALAEWSNDEADFELVTRRLRQEADEGRKQEYLNALRRDTRLVEGREHEAKELLIQVMLNASNDDSVRDLAYDFLKGYAPWDDNTYGVAMRYRADRYGR